MQWYEKQFEALTVQELYAIMRARVQIFVVEQRCPYLEVDGRDEQSMHIWAEDEHGLIAYCRMIPYRDQVHIGRVIVDERARGRGLGHTLMERAVKRAATMQLPIYLQAQAHLHHFYAMHGFVQRGDVYEEDGIPHIDMWNETPFSSKEGR